MTSSPFRQDCLQGRVALVTGGGSGICFEVTKQILLHGAKGAVICGRRSGFLERAAGLLTKETGRTCLWFACDVRDPDKCKDAVNYATEHLGRLDILINGAAGNFLAEARSLSPKGFATVLAIDAQGTFNMCHAAYPALCKNDGGNPIIINISATLQCPATHWQTHSSAAKAAVDSMTRSLALEWGRDNIRIVGIAPGPIADTPGMTKLAPGIGSTDIENMIKEGVPLRRLGKASEIGHAAVFLATATYISGDTLIVDGGEWLYKPPMVPRDMVRQLSKAVEAKSRAQAPESSL